MKWSASILTCPHAISVLMWLVCLQCFLKPSALFSPVFTAHYSRHHVYVLTLSQPSCAVMNGRPLLCMAPLSSLLQVFMRDVQRCAHVGFLPLCLPAATMRADLGRGFVPSRCLAHSQQARLWMNRSLSRMLMKGGGEKGAAAAAAALGITSTMFLTLHCSPLRAELTMGVDIYYTSLPHHDTADGFCDSAATELWFIRIYLLKLRKKTISLQNALTLLTFCWISANRQNMFCVIVMFRNILAPVYVFLYILTLYFIAVFQNIKIKWKLKYYFSIFFASTNMASKTSSYDKTMFPWKTFRVKTFSILYELLIV